MTRGRPVTPGARSAMAWNIGLAVFVIAGLGAVSHTAAVAIVTAAVVGSVVVAIGNGCGRGPVAFWRTWGRR